eukprot:UN26001
MQPDTEYLENINKEEASRLAGIETKLSENDKTNIVKQSKELKAKQETVQDVSQLPTLKISDISRQGLYYENEVFTSKSNNLKIHKAVQPTNGMVYLKALIVAEALPENLRSYLPLYCDCVTSMGADKMDYRELAHQIKLKTGGIDCSAGTFNHHAGAEN